MERDVIHEKILDVCALEPPEPLELAIAAAERLQRGELLRVRHRREPYPLYGLLDQSGYRHLTRPGTDCPWEILIWRADDPDVERAALAAYATTAPHKD